MRPLTLTAFTWYDIRLLLWHNELESPGSGMTTEQCLDPQPFLQAVGC